MKIWTHDIGHHAAFHCIKVEESDATWLPRKSNIQLCFNFNYLKKIPAQNIIDFRTIVYNGLTKGLLDFH